MSREHGSFLQVACCSLGLFRKRAKTDRHRFRERHRFFCTTRTYKWVRCCKSQIYRAGNVDNTKFMWEGYVNVQFFCDYLLNLDLVSINNTICGVWQLKQCGNLSILHMRVERIFRLIPLLEGIWQQTSDSTGKTYLASVESIYCCDAI